MALTYEELEGSPSFVMDREGGSARRIIKVAWSDIGRAILEVFPGALFGYPYTASVPGFKWLRANRMSIDAWNPEHPTGTGQAMNTYPGGAKITVDYAPYKWPDVDHADGPDAGDLQDITFLEHRIAYGGEYLTWPNGGIRWANDAAGVAEYSQSSGKVDAAQLDSKFKVFDDVNVGITIPTVEHSLTYNYVRFPPWTGIRNCIGKVNSVAIMNCVPETLLFTGATAERSYSTQGAPTWKLEYRLSEKCINYPLRTTYKLTNALVTAGGTGYAVGDNLVFVGGTGKPCSARVTTINVITGAVTGVLITNGGEYYTVPARPQKVGSTSGTGRNCFLTAGFRIRGVEEAHGWNHFLRPETGRFEKMLRKDGTSIYRGAPLRQLFGRV